MDKKSEIENPESCLNRAKDGERLFVLMGRDQAAPETIRFWAAERVKEGKNHPADRQIQDALECARLMEAEQAAAPKLADQD